MVGLSLLHIWHRLLPNSEHLGLQNVPHPLPPKNGHENALNLPALAAAPRQKYIRGRVLSWSWNRDSVISFAPHLLCTVVKKGDFWPRFAKQSTLMLSGFETNQHIWSVKVRCECQSLIYLISELPVQKTGGCKIALWKRGWKNSFDHQ